MYVHVQHFSSIIGITEGANMEARRIVGIQVKGIGDGVVIEPASFRRTYPNQQRKEREKNSDESTALPLARAGRNRKHTFFLQAWSEGSGVE